MIAAILDRLILSFECHASTPDTVQRAARILEWAVERPSMSGTLQEIQARRLRQTVSHAAKCSPFYQELFQSSGINPADITGIADLSKLPLTTSKDLRNWQQLLCVPEDKVATVFTTSGTTGEPKRVCFTLGDMQVLSNWGAVAMRFRNPGRMVAMIALPVSHGLWSGSATAQRIVERAGGLPISIGAADTQETLTWMKRFEPTFVISSPSFMTALTRRAQRDGFQHKLERILLSGELLTQEQKDSIGEYWNAQVFDSYGTTELGGGQSMAFPGCTAFHLNDLHLVTEIVDPETGLPADEGELVFTTLVREAMPLIRYRSGDRGRWATCKCGLPFRSIQVFGRTDDMMVAGDMNLFGKVIAEAVTEIVGTSGRLEIILEKVELTDRMTMRIEGEAIDEERVRRSLFDAYPEMNENIDNGNLLLDIECNVKLCDQHKSLRIRDRRSHADADASFDRASPEMVAHD